MERTTRRFRPIDTESRVMQAKGWLSRGLRCSGWAACA